MREVKCSWRERGGVQLVAAAPGARLLAQCCGCGEVASVWNNYAGLALDGLHYETRQTVAVQLHRLLQQLQIVVRDLGCVGWCVPSPRVLPAALTLMKPGSCGPNPLVVPGSHDMDTGTMVLP